MSNTTLSFIADKVRITGPKVDGGLSITFEVGESEQLKVAALLTLPQNEPINVEVTI